ncbi:MAG: hypothetical protein ACYTFT_00480 [Planctomycetota bacterium]
MRNRFAHLGRALATSTLSCVVALAISTTALALDRSQPQEISPREGAVGVPLRIAAAVTPDALERSGGWGHAMVDLRSTGTEPLRVELFLEAPEWSSVQLDFRKKLEVGPGEDRRVFLPVPPLEDGVTLRVEVGGKAFGSTDDSGGTLASTTWGNKRYTTLLVGVPASDVNRWSSAFDDAVSFSGPEMAVSAREFDELPPHFGWPTAFQTIAIDARREGITEARQQTLLDFAGTGGTLLVGFAGRLPEGPLKEALKQGDRFGSDSERTAYGFGQLASHEDAIDQAAWIQAYLLGDVPVGYTVEPKSPADARSLLRLFSFRQRIPSVGEVPVQLFVLMILTFVILAGPINYLYFRRKGRPAMALLVAPALGLGLTAGILLFGILGEGFATRGRLHSVTLLDQQAQQATTVGGMTLYAGIAPDHLEPGPSTWAVRSDPQDQYALLAADLTSGQRLTSGWVPARSEAGVRVVTRKTVRERIRFEKQGDSLRVLADPLLTPAPSEPLLVRDHAGDYFVGDGAGPLRAVSASVAISRLQDLLEYQIDRSNQRRRRRRSFVIHFGRRDESLSPWQIPGDHPPPHEVALAQAFEQRLGELRPGTFVGRFQDSPAFDRLGLDIDEKGEPAHFIIGRLGKEDIR